MVKYLAAGAIHRPPPGVATALAGIFGADALAAVQVRERVWWLKPMPWIRAITGPGRIWLRGSGDDFFADPELVLRLESVIKNLYAKHDYHEYGGAPLLGVNGVSLISHGSSKDRTIKNAILRGKAFAEAKINEKIVARLATVKLVEQVEA